MLADFLRPIGFDSQIFCLMTDHASIGQPAKHGIMSGYPDDWMKHYVASDYEPIDPIRKEAALNLQSIFSWDGIDRIRPYNKNERSILNQAGDAGLRNGVAVSLLNSRQERVCMGYASSGGKVELNPTTLSVLKLASIQFYDAYQALNRPAVGGRSPRVWLTEREREVLQWAALGKSNPDIATILDISDATVAYFLQRCFFKLDANSKTLAVVKAIRLGLIRLDERFAVHSTKPYL